MNKISTLAAGVALSALTITGAVASDLNGSLKDSPSFDAPSVVNWTGFYIGGNLGYGNANHNLSVNEYYKGGCSLFTQNQISAAPFSLQRYAVTTVDQYNAANNPDVKTCAEIDTSSAPGIQPPNNISGNSRELGSIDGINSRGPLGGAQIGYDLARGRYLFGIFADYELADMKSDVTINGAGLGGGNLSIGLEKDHEWSVGARAGLIVAPRTLAYILAAYTQTEYDVTGLSGINFGTGTKVTKGATFDGISVGGGIEFALANNIFLGMEYRHTFYGEETIFDAYNASKNSGIKVDDDLDEDKIMGTLKIKLNGDVFGR